MGLILTHTTTYIFKSIGFIFGYLRQHTNVGVCARYQANPKESHMIALKRIIKYVKTTADFGVWYNKDTNDVLAGYSNAD